MPLYEYVCRNCDNNLVLRINEHEIKKMRCPVHNPRFYQPAIRTMFFGGKTNFHYNAVNRHLETLGATATK